MRQFAVFISGLLFGAGVTVSGMVNPAKVQNFMDLFGAWDPTLSFVMCSGLVVTFLGYRMILVRERPWFAGSFRLPASITIDGRLMGGAALFGLGWGLTGLCPGPAIASLAFGGWQSFLFVIAMAAGMAAVRFITRQPVTPGQMAGVEG